MLCCQNRSVDKAEGKWRLCHKVRQLIMFWLTDEYKWTVILQCVCECVCVRVHTCSYSTGLYSVRRAMVVTAKGIPALVTLVVLSWPLHKAVRPTLWLVLSFLSVLVLCHLCFLSCYANFPLIFSLSFESHNHVMCLVYTLVSSVRCPVNCLMNLVLYVKIWHYCFILHSFVTVILFSSYYVFILSPHVLFPFSSPS